MERPLRLASFAIAVLAAFAALAGLLADGLYRDNLLVRSGWLGNDLVTLLVATPVLVVATRSAGRGSVRGRLVWLGVLAYMVYNFAFYLFGAAFNALFLPYVALFALSTYTLVAALIAIDVRPVESASVPRWVSLWMAAVALLLGGFWVATSAAFLVTGDVPAVVTAVGIHTNLIAALDLSMVVPLNALGAVWLWRGRPWGVVLAAIANVKGALYMPALVAATLSAAHAGAAEVAQVGLWGPIGAGSLLASLALLRRVPPP